MGAVELDDLLLSLGIKGFYPLGLWAILLLPRCVKMVMFMGNAMVAFPVKFDCLDNVTLGNRSVEEVCSSCPSDSEWIYDTPRANSLVAYFDLVCDRARFLGIIDVFFFVGGILGSTFIGILSDRFGRRSVLISVAFTISSVGVATFFVNSLEFYIVTRFILGVAYIGLMTQVTYKAELFPSKFRFIAVTLDVGWILSNPFFPLFAYLIPSWHHLLGSLLTASAILIPVFYLMPESVPWLIRKGRHEEALDILVKVAESRGKMIDEEDFYDRVVGEGGKDRPRDEKEEENGGKLLKITRHDLTDVNRQKAINFDETTTDVADTTTTICFVDGVVEGKNNNNDGADRNAESKDEGGSFWRALTCPIYFWALTMAGAQWSYTTMVFIVISFSYGSLGGDRLVTYLILALTDFPGKFASVVVVFFVGRRLSLFLFSFWAGLPLVAIALARLRFEDLEEELPGFRLAMCVVSRIGMWFLYESSQIFSQETFPTLLRARSYLIAMMMSRAVSAVASFIATLMESHAMAIELFMGLSGVAIAFLAFLVAETRDQPLPQTINDLKEMKQRTGNLLSCGNKKKLRIQQKAIENDNPSL